MHDGTTPHFLFTVRQNLNKNFDGEWIGIASPVNYPAPSYDSPVDFWLYSKPISDFRGIETTSSWCFSGHLEQHTLLSDKEVKVVLTCMGTTQSIFSRENTNIIRTLLNIGVWT
jgi:hypothetical protein